MQSVCPTLQGTDLLQESFCTPPSAMSRRGECQRLCGHTSKPAQEFTFKSRLMPMRARAWGDCEAQFSRNWQKQKGVLQTFPDHRSGWFSLSRHLQGREATRYFSYTANLYLLPTVFTRPWDLILSCLSSEVIRTCQVVIISTYSKF